jgi:16S rRNA (guanine966-N2)-methyltransferase
MRIIAGSLRRRTLEAPAGLATRPTSDRLRETLFNVLAPEIEGARFLDLYAGSGAVGIEALSRGAESITFAERSPAALRDLRRPRTSDAAGFDVVFLDPPYEEENEYAGTLGLLGGTAAGLLDEKAVVIAEHRRKQRLSERYGRLTRTRLLEQGDAALSFYAANSAESTE